MPNLLRIHNVSTHAVERINCEEEERMRQGFEMQTAVRFATVDHRLRVFERTFSYKQRPLLVLQYAPVATLHRMNLGWRRRAEPSIFGFNINAVDGRWTGDPQAPNKSKPEASETALVQRITPYVEDRRNVLIVRLADEYPDEVITTLQYALKRGIELIWQLEESLNWWPNPCPTPRTADSLLRIRRGRCRCAHPSRPG